ncbi:MAG TPA: hypothetical protein VGF79_05490 [Bacteroidia bacterium]
MNSNKSIFLNSLIAITCLVSVFHILIITSIIPYEHTWGGRLKSIEEMYVFETLSLLINSFLLFVLLQKSERLKSYLSQRSIRIILWIFFSVFLLNTLGNLLAKTIFEKIFSIITLINAYCIWKINRGK